MQDMQAQQLMQLSIAVHFHDEDLIVLLYELIHFGREGQCTHAPVNQYLIPWYTSS